MDEKEIRQAIADNVRKFYELKQKDRKFKPGFTELYYGEAIYDHSEVNAMIDSVLNGWLGIGKKGMEFENNLSDFLDIKSFVLSNSGSSANLLAVSALCSPQFRDRLKPGDEVITQAMTFPTTFNPIVQNRLKPVLIDCNLGSYTVDTDALERAMTEKTRAVVFHHPLGNPNDMNAIMEVAAEYDLFVVEDCCDALGSEFNGKKLGSFGNLSTFSFYAPHHMTLGEGGAVGSNDLELSSVVRSLRDWGRVAWCPQCKIPLDTTYNCPHRFEPVTDTLPADYDRRFTFVNVGYNLKPLELQAAWGVEQLKRLLEFTKRRRKNFKMLYDALSRYNNYFILPESHPKSDPSWFAFPLTVKEKSPFKRKEIMQWLEKHKIHTRMMFVGNIVNHPAYNGVEYKVADDLKNSDLVMRNSFFFGLHQGLDDEKILYIIEKLDEFMRRFGG